MNVRLRASNGKSHPRYRDHLHRPLSDNLLSDNLLTDNLLTDNLLTDSLLHAVGDEDVNILSLVQQHHGSEVTQTFV